MKTTVNAQSAAQSNMLTMLMAFCARGPFVMPQVMQKVVMPLQKWKIAAHMPRT